MQIPRNGLLPAASTTASRAPLAASWRMQSGIADRSRFYFVHSYYPQPAEPALTAATADYGARFTCAVARDNIFAVQFHPEKSQSSGLQLLSNFVQWRP